MLARYLASVGAGGGVAGKGRHGYGAEPPAHHRRSHEVGGRGTGRLDRLRREVRELNRKMEEAENLAEIRQMSRLGRDLA